MPALGDPGLLFFTPAIFRRPLPLFWPFIPLIMAYYVVSLQKSGQAKSLARAKIRRQGADLVSAVAAFFSTHRPTPHPNFALV